jgi:Tfp pilus assembly protein PilO
MSAAALLRARTAYLARRLGPVGWCGLAALVLSAATAVGGRIWLDPANAALREELAQMNEQLARARRPDAAFNAPADPIAAIVAQLPPADQLPAFVESVQAQASRKGLQIDRTEYRVQKALAGRALRYQLSMPAHGAYPKLRNWVEQLLHDYPSAALDELSLHRESDGSAQLEARVTLSFYSRGVN